MMGLLRVLPRIEGIESKYRYEEKRARRQGGEVPGHRISASATESRASNMNSRAGRIMAFDGLIVLLGRLHSQPVVHAATTR